MSRLGSFRAHTGRPVPPKGWLVFVFDDALVAMRPSLSLDVADVLAGGEWGKRVAKLRAEDLDKRETAVSLLSENASSQEVAQQFKRSRRTALDEIYRVELHPPGPASTAYRLEIRTTNGKTARLFVKTDEAPRADDLLSRALGPRFQSEPRSSVSG